jgi:predicted ATP-binding protein involved in virulence
MRIHNLTLKNIGPFKDAYLEFIGPDDNSEKSPVIIITGENGTGKTIVIDAIRALFYGESDKIERDVTSSINFLIKSELTYSKNRNKKMYFRINLEANSKNVQGNLQTNDYEFTSLFGLFNLGRGYKDDFVLNYWTSKLSNDSFNINAIESPKTNDFLQDSLSGIHLNTDVTKLITFFDYLSDSKDENERKVGMKIYSIIKKIIDLSITDGHLSHVSRTQLQPKISIKGKEISLDKLSSGNLYIIQRFIYLLKQMYAVHINHGVPIEEITQIPGLIFIDEAENHLHPKWQKVFLNNLLEIFPNLQIIITTHSPFIVSSVENARIFVCSSEGDGSVIKEETDFYRNKPIEEILMSPLFNTSNFNAEISELMSERKKAIASKNKDKANEIEDKLLELNPEYFNYLKIDKLIEELQK